MPPEGTDWAYDVAARVYDDDMAKSAPPGDVEYYVARTGERGGRVLELGAGTGRITLPLVASGLTVTAVDRSEPMLRVLAEKAEARLGAVERGRLSIVHADMRDLPFPGPFETVLCPYSAFTYLVTEDDRRRMLAGVRSRLAPGGVLLLDVFVPDPAMNALPDDHVFLDYRRPRADGTTLERTKLVRKDVEPGVNVLERRYEILAPDGSVLERFVTQTKIHYWHPGELERELERHGFVVKLVPDFGRRTGAPEKTAVFECSVGDSSHAVRA